jgi:phosphoribosylpyrophosphate synthetase
MVDDVQSFVAAAEVLKERGAYKIYVLATHGLLSSDAPRLIEDSPIDEVSCCVLLYNNLNPEIELQIIVGNRLLDSTC